MRASRLVLLLPLAACAQDPVGPYFAVPPLGYRQPNERGELVRVDLCYGRLTSSLEEVRGLVARNCTAAEPLGQQYDLNVCSIAMPVRATFACGAISDELAAQRAPMPLR